MEGKHIYEESAWLMQRQTKAGKFFLKRQANLKILNTLYSRLYKINERNTNTNVFPWLQILTTKGSIKIEQFDSIQLQIYIICDRITWIYPSRVGKIVSQTKGKRYPENSSITSIFSYLPDSMIPKILKELLTFIISL